MSSLSDLHDAYAAAYDAQVAAYDCYIAEALFGLCYDFVRPGERLLDLGIGSGLSAAPFARAGLRVSGMDFAPAMLDLCRAKGIAEELRRHDLQDTPWPYDAASFEHVICVGVFHFIGGLETVFAEVARVVRPGGLFAFTTRWPSAPLAPGAPFERRVEGELDVFSHAPETIAALMAGAGFDRVRQLRCYVGQDLFAVWVARSRPRGRPPA